MRCWFSCVVCVNWLMLYVFSMIRCWLVYVNRISELCRVRCVRFGVWWLKLMLCVMRLMVVY